ncbi:MAG: long-chain fatty acid--CoA ligase [Catenulispora sp.]|nr:long-chain fatty acid--CoA ligase [Catenulispora sp.]
MKDPGHYVARILEQLAFDDDRPVIRWQDAVIPAAELRSALTRVAAALDGLGVGDGGTVAVLTGVNSPWMLATRYAVHLLGATVVYVSGSNHGTTTHGLTRETRARMVRETGASVLLFDEENAAEAEGIRAMLASQTALGLCALGTPLSGAVSVGGRPIAAPAADDAVLTPRTPARAMVIYTSGSTGRPKGVVKPFVAWNDVVLGEASRAPAKTFLAVSAVSHTGGLLTDMAIASGGSALLRTVFEPAAFLRDIADHRVTDTLIGVPLLYELASHPDAPTTDLSSLRRLLYIGCAASPERVREAVKVFPGVLHHSYGTTETGQIAMLTAADHDVAELLDTVGRPRTDLTVAIRDPESGRGLPAGHLGEVVVRGANNMLGYVADPALTDRVLRDGWVHTGDLGRIGDNGYLRLFGRMDDVVKVHDTRVHPIEVEKVLAGHPGVADACVWGHRGPDLLGELHAAVVLRDDDPPADDVLRDHVARAMTPTHVPATLTRWRAFPINANGKVDRVLVREQSSHPEAGRDEPAWPHSSETTRA